MKESPLCAPRQARLSRWEPAWLMVEVWWCWLCGLIDSRYYVVDGFLYCCGFEMGYEVVRSEAVPW